MKKQKIIRTKEELTEIVNESKGKKFHKFVHDGKSSSIIRNYMSHLPIAVTVSDSKLTLEHKDIEMIQYDIILRQSNTDRDLDGGGELHKVTFPAFMNIENVKKTILQNMTTMDYACVIIESARIAEAYTHSEYGELDID